MVGVTFEEFCVPDGKIYVPASNGLPQLKIDDDFTRLTMNDYEDFTRRVDLDCSDFAKIHLSIQSIEGHASNGHCMFDHNKFPDSTIEDVLEALFIDVNRFKEERQREIDRVFLWVYQAIKGANHERLVLDNEPLFGINIFNEIGIKDIEDVLFGIYLDGIMDNFGWRQKVLKNHGYQMGGGECVAVNLPKLKKLRWSVEALAENENVEWLIKALQENKAILTNGNMNSVRGTREVVSGFVRYKKGYGVSDDAAVINAGVIYGLDVAMGVFLADAIDTWDKCAANIVKGGQDEYLGNMIRKEMPMGVDDEKLVEFIYISAVCPRKPTGDPDCSQRYFLQIDEKTKNSAIRSHIAFIQHMLKYMNTSPRDRKDRNPRQRIGFNRVWNSAFYHNQLKPTIYAYMKGELPDYSGCITISPSRPSQK